MENRFNFRKVAVIILGLFYFSCVPGDDFGVPQAKEDTEVILETNTTLNAVLGAFYQSQNAVATFQQDLVVEAYVVSSDEAGNFYKELIVQDKPQNPTAGLAVQINLNSYFTRYDFGRKIYIKLKGLSIAENNGVLMLGLANGTQIEPIARSKISDYVIRSSQISEIVPLPVKAIAFTDALENLYVKFEGIQFSRFLVNPQNPFTYASEANDEFDGERLVESCTGDFPFVLSTSTFADFKTFVLPSGSGNLTGILTRDFYDEKYTVYLNSPEDIHFSEGERCDPPTFDCGLATSVGANILFEADFEEQENNDPIEGYGWTNYVQEGSEAWEGFEASGENESLGRSARVQTSGSGDYKTLSWLITSKIDFDAQDEEVLQFKTSTSFANHSMLEVLISTDWDGNTQNIQKAKWEILSSAYIAKKSDFFGAWISSGKVDLSCAEGQGYIAFKFTGSDLETYDGIFELDEVLITSKWRL